jgi:hypothetical protein
MMEEVSWIPGLEVNMRRGKNRKIMDKHLPVNKIITKPLNC